MGDQKSNGVNSEGGPQENPSVEMESIRRVSKLPVVESTINLASDIYSKVKDSNAMVGNALDSAENALKQAAGKAQPMAASLGGPLKTMDSVLCSSLDYVETHVPSIKLPPHEMYENSKNAVYNTVQPAFKCVCAMTGYGQKPAITADKTCKAGDNCCLHGKESCSKAFGTTILQNSMMEKWSISRMKAEGQSLFSELFNYFHHYLLDEKNVVYVITNMLRCYQIETEVKRSSRNALIAVNTVALNSPKLQPLPIAKLNFIRPRCNDF